MFALLRDYTQKAKPLLKRAPDTLFPARCAACAEPVGSHGMLCAPCWAGIHFIGEPACYKCGLPFQVALGPGTLCGHCMQQMPHYTQARAVFRYDEQSRNQVLALKYQDKTQLAPVFGQWLARAGAEFTVKADMIVPVPLYYWRLLKRRYNQAALLSYALAQHTALPVVPDSLIRARATPSQAGRSRPQREENMRGAFAVSAKKKATFKGKSVLLVDDVMTTGATVNACARALHDAGAKDVYVLTLACAVIADWK